MDAFITSTIVYGDKGAQISNTQYIMPVSVIRKTDKHY